MRLTSYPNCHRHPEIKALATNKMVLRFLKALGPIPKSGEMLTIISEAECDLIVRVANQLPPLDKAIIRLRFWENYALFEIADALDLPVGIVEKIYHHTLHLLKMKYLADRVQLEAQTIPSRKDEMTT